MRVAIYARYSSEFQNRASIEDQIRLAREHPDRQGWTVVEIYTDYGISGASMMRPGLQAMLADAKKRKFDAILSEALDRISRDQLQAMRANLTAPYLQGALIACASDLADDFALGKQRPADEGGDGWIKRESLRSPRA